MKAIMHFHEAAQTALKNGVSLSEIENAAVLQKIARMKELPLEIAIDRIRFLVNETDNEFMRFEEMREKTNA